MVAPTAVSKAQSALHSMRDAERSALDNSDSGSEADNGGFYTGKGKTGTNTKAKIKKKLGKSIATILLVGMIGGGGFFLSSTNSLLPGTLEAVTTQNFDVQYSSIERRAPLLVSRAVKKETSAFGYGRMSKKFVTRLAENGITVEGSGKTAKVTFEQVDTNGKTIKQTISADEIPAKIQTDAEFRKAYQTARRGRVANFFDNVASKVLQRIGAVRDTWRGFKRSADADTNAEQFSKTMTTKYDKDTTAIYSVGKAEEEKVDADGNKIIDPDTGKAETEIVNKSNQVEVDNSKVSEVDANIKAKNMVADVANKVTTIGNFACTIPNILSVLGVMIAAQEIYQSIKFYTPFMESISKTKSGEGDGAPINESMNFFSTTATTKTTKFGPLKITEGENTEGKEDVVVQTGTPLESNGMQMLLAGVGIMAGTSALFSLERSNRFAWASTSTTAEACIAEHSAAAVVSIGVALATLGTSTIASNLFSFTVNSVIGTVLPLALGFMLPTIAKVFFTNAFETAVGIPGGELFAKGGSAMGSRLGRNASGQSLSSESAAIAYNKVNQEVLALDAEIDRKTLSPFDISNKNTFLGSIAFSLLPITTKSNITNISSLLSVTGKSISSIISSNVSADGKDTSYMTKFGDCKSLESIGAVGDVYCNPIITTDVSTLDMDPEDDRYLEVINADLENCDAEGNGCTVKDDTDLANFIKYCNNRDSPFGVVDQNILGEMESSSGLGSWRGIVAAVPFIGDAVDLIDAAQDEKNLPWTTGERCGNTEQNSEFWQEKGKYYQRFIEDMRILQQLGAFEDDNINPVMSYMEKYEAEHPIDDSFVGYMSRISGILPENVETVLAFMDYYQYVNEYDPTQRISMTDHPSIVEDSNTVAIKAETEAKKSLKNSTDKNSEVVMSIIQPIIIYADLRNRNYAV